jgi:tetratricopeptide (TPR) repeat protein
VALYWSLSSKYPFPALLILAVLSGFPLAAFQTEPLVSLAQARIQLYAGRYDQAVLLFRKVLDQQPAEADAWYGLVRAQLGLHHSREAYAVADEALMKAPGSAGAESAAGLVMYRRGDLSKAEAHFRAALKIKPDYPDALRGMASIYTSLSLFKTAHALRLRAYTFSPDDPELMLEHANTLKADARIKAIQATLATYDPRSAQAQSLGVSLANMNAVGQRKLGRLTSPYASGTVKLFPILDGPKRQLGVGLTLRLNGKQNVNLMLDTGASGISLSPKLAEKAGLQMITSQTFQVNGVGDEKRQSATAYLASEVKAGDIVFTDYPIAVFTSAKSENYDGLIGADVFARFLVKVDFAQLLMSLDPRPEGQNPEDEPADWKTAPAGFVRFVRFGDHIAIPTFVNEATQPTLFLLDSGSSSNLIDTDVAKQFASVSDDSRRKVVGVQGKIADTARANRVSLVFAGYRYDNPDLIAINLEKMSDSMGVGFGGIIGMPVLSKLIVTLNYIQGVVKFEHRNP